MGNEMNELRYLDLKNTLCEKYMKAYIRWKKIHRRDSYLQTMK
mgnify:CR=1 FL=1